MLFVKRRFSPAGAAVVLRLGGGGKEKGMVVFSRQDPSLVEE